jgi:hypothetical protein
MMILSSARKWVTATLAIIFFFLLFLLAADILFGLLFRLAPAATPLARSPETSSSYTADAEIEEIFWLPNFILPSSGFRNKENVEITPREKIQRERTHQSASLPRPWLFPQDESGISFGRANYRGALVSVDFRAAENLVNRHSVLLNSNGWRVSETMLSRTNADRHLWVAGCSQTFGYVGPEETIPVALAVSNPRWVSYNLGIIGSGPLDSYFAQIKNPPAIASRGKRGMGIFFFSGVHFERALAQASWAVKHPRKNWPLFAIENNNLVLKKRTFLANLRKAVIYLYSRSQFFRYTRLNIPPINDYWIEAHALAFEAMARNYRASTRPDNPFVLVVHPDWRDIYTDRLVRKMLARGFPVLNYGQFSQAQIAETHPFMNPIDYHWTASFNESFARLVRTDLNRWLKRTGRYDLTL